MVYQTPDYVPESALKGIPTVESIGISTSIPYLGEMMALTTAATWAVAVILFRKSGETVQPIALNLFKNILAAVLFIPTILIVGEDLLYPVSRDDLILLLVSGAIGIGVSDTLFFKCLNQLGAGLTAIVDCLYSPFIIGLSILWLNESLSIWQVVGVVLIISAVLTAISRKGSEGLGRQDLLWGILWGALAMATVAIGVVMVKPVLNRAPLLWITEVRIIAGIIILIPILFFHPRRTKIVGSLIRLKNWGYTISGSFVGAYMSTALWLAGMKFAQASVAAALNQSNTIFIFVFAAIFLKEPINRQRTIGIILGVAGSLIVTFA
jgi:drug/metabolite transporter (DMT)-like permease